MTNAKEQEVVNEVTLKFMSFKLSFPCDYALVNKFEVLQVEKDGVLSGPLVSTRFSLPKIPGSILE